MINVNARSLTNKVGDLECILANYDPHVITITETWLRPEIQDQELVPPNYKIICRDRDARGGGVAVVIKADIDCVQMPGIPTHESVWCQIKLDNTMIILGAVYRPPNSPISYLEDIQLYLEGLRIRSSRIIISGDFNLPGIDWSELSAQSREKTQCELLLEIAFSHDLQQVVQGCTRIVGKTGSILDLVFLDGRFEEYDVSIEAGLSDHKLVYLEIKQTTVCPRADSTSTHVLCFDRADDTSIIDHLSLCLDSFSQTNDVNAMWDEFKGVLFHCINRFVPMKRRKKINATHG